MKEKRNAPRSPRNAPELPDRISAPLPEEVVKRFPSMKEWQDQIEANWTQVRQSIRDRTE